MSKRRVVQFVVLGAAAVTLAGYSVYAKRMNRAVAADQVVTFAEKFDELPRWTGTGTWIDEPDGDDCVRYIRADLDATRRQELADALEKAPGFANSSRGFDGVVTWLNGKVLEDSLCSKLLAYLREPYTSKGDAT